MSTCTKCTAATNGVALCGRCDKTLTVALVNVPAYWADVSRIQPGASIKSPSVHQSAEPVGSTGTGIDRIGEATASCENTVQTWIRALEDGRSVTYSAPKRTADTPPGFDVRHGCAWLEEHRRTVLTLPWAGDLLRDLLAAERMLRRIIDNYDTGWYAGLCGNEIAPERVHDDTTCGCGCHHGYDDCDEIMGADGCGRDVTILPATTCQRSLYATLGVNWVRCPECGRAWDVEQRRQVMMREARDRLAPVAVIARAVVGLMGNEVSVQRLANRIDQWIHRGKLHDLGVRVLDDRRPHRVYRIGDVFDLMERDLHTTDGEAC